jgi:hypothetical protein
MRSREVYDTIFLQGIVSRDLLRLVSDYQQMNVFGKNAEFHADFKSVEKVVKNAQKIFIKFVLLITFLYLFSKHFQRI